MKVVCLLILWLATAVLALAQTSPVPVNPAAANDEQAEHEKLLKMEDQWDALQAQVEALHTQADKQSKDTDQLKSDLAQAQNDNSQLKTDLATLKTAIEKLDADREVERAALLKEISKMLADATKPAPAAPPPEPPAKPDPTPAPTATEVPASVSPGETGFNYVVKKGDTLHDIAAAYQSQGVKVTLDDIRKANKMSKTAYIYAGQKLFIPKKE